MALVNSYSLSWSGLQNRGYVLLTIQGGQKDQIEVDSPSELSAFGDLLRKAAKIEFDTQSKSLTTAWLPPGS